MEIIDVVLTLEWLCDALDGNLEKYKPLPYAAEIKSVNTCT
jgi:hypothetical protein